jgi:carbamoyl-phosphate synthase small subunit
MKISKTVVLLLQDGRFFYGEKFGSDGETIGEVCFNTGMTGYQEILALSYCQQMVEHVSKKGYSGDNNLIRCGSSGKGYSVIK